jgi:hypothetical protein
MKEIVQRLLNGEMIIMNDENYLKLTAYIQNETDDQTYEKFGKLVSEINREYSLGVIRYYDVYLRNKTVKCLNCSHVNKIKEDNVYQDIRGKFIVCEECEGSFDIE